MGVSHFVSALAFLTFALFLSCPAFSATAESECATNKDGEHCNIMSDAFVQVRSHRSSVQLSEEHVMMQAAGEDKSVELRNQEANAVVRHNNASGNKEVSLTDTKRQTAIQVITCGQLHGKLHCYALYYNFPNDNVRLSSYTIYAPPQQAFYRDGDQLKSKHDNKCLENSIHNNKVVMRTCNNQNNQKWELVDYPHGSNPDKFLKSKHDHRCLDFGSLYFESATDIIMRDCDAKTWSTKPGGKIESHQDSGKCLDYDYNSAIKNVIVYDCNTGNNQVWSWHKHYHNRRPSGWTLRSAHDSKCLDYSTSDRNVIMWSCNSQANQKWNKEKLSGTDYYNNYYTVPGFALKSNDKSQGRRCLEYGAYPNRDNTFMGFCRNAAVWNTGRIQWVETLKI